MFGCLLSQLKPSEFCILSCEKGLGLRPQPFSQLLGLYPIHNQVKMYTFSAMSLISLSICSLYLDDNAVKNRSEVQNF